MLYEKTPLKRFEYERLDVPVRQIFISLTIKSENLNCNQQKEIIEKPPTCNLPKTLIKTPPSNIGCESTAVIILLIF